MKDVYLLSGFLGSGKTSTLVDWIRQLKERQLKPAVMMNEFGQLAFDSAALDADIPLQEVLAGCICCTGADVTEAKIQTLLYEEEFDVLIIETTGVAHPVAALDAVYSPLFADQLNVRGIVTVVDSKLWFDRQRLSPPLLALFVEQVRHAHLLLVNKCDLVTEDDLARVTYELQMVNPHAFTLQTTNGKVAFHVVEQYCQATHVKEVTETFDVHHQLRLSTRLIRLNRSFSVEEFEAWIRSLPDTVYRIKGYVPIEGVREPMLFQYSYGLVQWLPEYVMMEPQIVVIGENVGQLAMIQ